jgi:hypothetical protein
VLAEMGETASEPPEPREPLPDIGSIREAMGL